MTDKEEYNNLLNKAMELRRKEDALEVERQNILSQAENVKNKKKNIFLQEFQRTVNNIYSVENLSEYEDIILKVTAVNLIINLPVFIELTKEQFKQNVLNGNYDEQHMYGITNLKSFVNRFPPNELENLKKALGLKYFEIPECGLVKQDMCIPQDDFNEI